MVRIKAVAMKNNGRLSRVQIHIPERDDGGQPEQGSLEETYFPHT